MVESYFSTKFGINLLDGFWENGFYGRTMDNGRLRHGISSADTELKCIGLSDPVANGKMANHISFHSFHGRNTWSVLEVFHDFKKQTNVV